MPTVHVSPRHIRKNRKLVENENVTKLEDTIYVWEDDEDNPRLVKEAIIYGQDGLEAARVVFRANGLRGKPKVNVYVETENKVGYIK